MAELAEKRWTVEEFLAWDDGTDRRYELVDGKVVEIALQPEAHGTILANLAALLHNGLQRPCRALLRAGVVPPGREGTYYQADLLVTCSPPEPGRQYPPAPTLIAEVLSELTAVLDRGQKLDDYRRLPSVRDILLVSSEERRICSWRRDGRHWNVEEMTGEAEVSVEAVPEPIPVAAIYEGSGA